MREFLHVPYICRYTFSMSTKTKFGTFDDLMAVKKPAIVEIATALRNLVLEIHPEAVEVVRLGDKAATFGVGPKKMSEAYTYVMPLTNNVNLGFFWGTQLADPQNLLEGTGKNLRHIKVKALEQVSSPAIRDMIIASISERRNALGL